MGFGQDRGRLRAEATGDGAAAGWPPWPKTLKTIYTWTRKMTFGFGPTHFEM